MSDVCCKLLCLKTPPSRRRQRRRRGRRAGGVGDAYSSARAPPSARTHTHFTRTHSPKHPLSHPQTLNNTPGKQSKPTLAPNSTSKNTLLSRKRTTMSIFDELFDAVDRGKDGALDFGDVVFMLKRMSPDQSLASARNAAVEALLLIGRGEAALAPPTAATATARRLDRADFRLLLERVAAMAGVDPVEAAGKLLAQARRSSFCLAEGGAGDGEEQDDASVAREVAAVDRTDSRLAAGGGAAVSGGSEVRVLPSEEATKAAAAAVEATGVGGGGGGGGGGGAGGASAGAAAAPCPPPLVSPPTAAATAGKKMTTPGRKALALATDPQLGVLFNAWCGGGGGGTSSSGGGAAAAAAADAPSSSSSLLSLADLAQGLCRLRPPQNKQDIAAALAEASRALAAHDSDGDGMLGRAEFAAFISSLLSAAGVAFGDVSSAFIEAAQQRPASEAMRRTLEAHGDLAARVFVEGRGRQGAQGQQQGGGGGGKV